MQQHKRGISAMMTRTKSIICVQHAPLPHWGSHYNGLCSVAVTNWNVWRTFCRIVTLFNSVSTFWSCENYNSLALRYIWRFFSHMKAIWLVLSSRRPGYDLGSIHVRVVADEVALGRGFLRVIWFDPVSVISPMLHINLHLHAARTRRTNGRSLGTFTKETLLRKLGSIK
jgi:hypothetical protein